MVLAADSDGRLNPDRVDAWRRLEAEGLRQEARRDAHLRAEQLRKWKTRTKALRSAATQRHPESP